MLTLPSPPLPDVAAAAEQLRHDPQMLHRTQDQARSALLFAQLRATQEEARLLARALEALNEPEPLATRVYLISRAYRHAGRLMSEWAGRGGQDDRPRLTTQEENAREWERREQFLLAVSRNLESAA
ncbi:hypothetical protein ACFPAF_16830 [Hymenobacter endophyticus]|uniref:Tetratricopeptide repeat protein n=1 Tax=Hymenobacter endophyticus TaxID=3076335 RepID=A0ABU3TL15_9BACT|nr:hypothetical protein [Hymenobacter endophyticus]MDU0372069.1 hypothetical protein [Hymenobacter endophyticus]